MTEVRVSRVGFKGDGVVETPSGPLHVPKVLPGELIDVEGDRLLRVVAASPDRVEPFCRHYAQCGGCKFQHWREAPYTDWKEGIVAEALDRHALRVVSAPMVDAHGEGRRRVTFHVRLIEGAWRAGFMEQKTHALVAVDECPVLAPALQASPVMAAAFGSVLGPCDVAVTLADNGMDVAVKAERKAVERRVAALVELFRSHNLVRLSVNGDEVAQREKPMVKVANSRLNLPSGSFLQATKRGEEVLVAAVMESLPRTKHILDLFSGVGTFTLPMASRARVTAYDLDKPAIAALLDAARNTQGLKPIEAQVRNLFTAPLTPQELKGYDCVVIDPPRAGAEAQVKALARSDVENLTYVSCDPTSFARDARILMEGGFSLESLAPIDQFKWTAHVELVGVFRR